MANYILTDEILLINNSGTTLHRIMATTTFSDVMEGDLGGWIESKKNISGDGWVYDEAKVYGEGSVSENAKVYDNAVVFGDASLDNDAELHDNVVIFGGTKIRGTAKLFGDIEVGAPIEIVRDSWSGITAIKGSKHWVWQPTKNNITVECKTYKIEKWVSDYQQIGELNGYNQEQIDEYGVYFQQIADLYN